MTRAGKSLIGAFFLCLTIGGATVNIFVPQMRGAGLTPTTLAILIPIWSIGGIGLLAMVFGWTQRKVRIRAALRRTTIHGEETERRPASSYPAECHPLTPPPTGPLHGTFPGGR